MKVVLSESLSYCIGVRKTIELVNRLLTDSSQRAYYMLGDVVHNEHVIRDLQSRGLNVVRSIADVPSDRWHRRIQGDALRAPDSVLAGSRGSGG